MEKRDGSSIRKLHSEQELKHFKAIVRSIMADACKDEAMAILEAQLLKGCRLYCGILVVG